MITTDKPTLAKPILREAQHKAAERFLESSCEPFRRSSLSAVLYPLTSPRSHQRADMLADFFVMQWTKAGKICHRSHVYWEKVANSVTLPSGRTVPQLAETALLSLRTLCPAKWISLDQETGEIWVGSPFGWRVATAAERREAVASFNPKRKRA